MFGNEVRRHDVSTIRASKNESSRRFITFFSIIIDSSYTAQHRTNLRIGAIAVRAGTRKIYTRSYNKTPSLRGYGLRRLHYVIFAGCSINIVISPIQPQACRGKQTRRGDRLIKHRIGNSRSFDENPATCYNNHQDRYNFLILVYGVTKITWQLFARP